ncbi:laccase-4 [Quercus suber]|uniref:Laccase-4 n=1 Tax=Quercus suber TaxID=58331 RepID=A0AAW0KXD1_QUESU
MPLLTTNQGIGKYIITLSPFMDAPIGLDNMTNYATLRYKGTPTNPPTILTSVPAQNATPVKVPLNIDHSLLFTVGVGVNPCATCVNGSQLVADINNLSFKHITLTYIPGVFTDDFPGNPPIPFNYTGNPSTNIQTMNGTRLYRLPHNATLQIVFQGTAGLGNFDSNKDPRSVWLLHCNLEVHITWGLKMAYLVENGEGPNESLPPPPSDLPKC